MFTESCSGCRAHHWFAACLAFCAIEAGAAANATVVRQDSLELELRPRICTLSVGDDQCETTVNAQWRSPRDESLCLVIVGRPEVKRCWEKYSKGVYTIELSFSQDLIVELRDLQLQQVLVSKAVKVIREALQLRRKRRQPWNIF